MKKILSALICISLIFSLATVSFAATGNEVSLSSQSVYFEAEKASAATVEMSFDTQAYTQAEPIELKLNLYPTNGVTINSVCANPELSEIGGSVAYVKNEDLSVTLTVSLTTSQTLSTVKLFDVVFVAGSNWFGFTAGNGTVMSIKTTGTIGDSELNIGDISVKYKAQQVPVVPDYVIVIENLWGKFFDAIIAVINIIKGMIA